MKESYYVTAGGNGGIITGDYANALLCGHYMCGEVLILEFGDFESAEEYLLEHLAEAPRLGVCCRLNEMVSIPECHINAWSCLYDLPGLHTGPSRPIP